MNLYDENEMLNIQINNLKSENTRMKSKKQDKEINLTDYKMIEVAKELLLENCLYSWSKIYVEYDEEKDIYTAEKYERWLEKKLCKDEIPENFSVQEFKTALDDRLHELYEREKEEEIRNKKAKREENE